MASGNSEESSRGGAPSLLELQNLSTRAMERHARRQASDALSGSTAVSYSSSDATPTVQRRQSLIPFAPTNSYDTETQEMFQAFDASRDLGSPPPRSQARRPPSLTIQSPQSEGTIQETVLTMPSHSPRRSQAPPQSWYHPWTNSESRGTHFGASATIVGHAFAQNRLPFDLDQFLNSPASSTSTMAQRRSPSPGLMQAAQAAQTAQTAQGQAGNRILGMNSPVRVMMPPMPPSRAPNIQFGPGGVASGQPMQGPPSVPPTPTNLVFNDNITAMPIHGGPWPPEEVIHREEYLNGLAAIAYQAILIAPPGPPPRNWSPAIVIHPFYRELANRFQRFLTQALQQIGIVYPQPRLQELWIVLMREIFLAIELQFMSAMLGTMQNPIDLEQVRFPPYVQHYVQATLAFQQAINLPSVPPPSMWHPQMNMHPHYESVVLRFQEEFRRILHEREDFIIDDDFMTQQMLNKQTRRMFAVMREQWANVNIQMGPRPPSTPSSGRPIGPPAQGMNIPPGTLMTLPQGQVIATPHGQVLVLQPTGPRPMVSPPPGHPSAAPQPQSGRNPHMGGH